MIGLYAKVFLISCGLRTGLSFLIAFINNIKERHDEKEPVLNDISYYVES